MNKRLLAQSFLICVLLVSVVVGFKDAPKNNDNQTILTIEDLNENKVEINQAVTIEENNKVESIEYAEEKEILSEEDMIVNAEIAKYNDNAASFTQKKQEKIGTKEYTLVFEQVGFSSTGGDESERVTYKTSSKDYFIYNVKTGNLESAILLSNYVEKTENSIDIDFAEKIARETISQKCDIDKYVLYEKREVFDGYIFKYGKYIGDYRTAEGVNITVAFNGEISNIGLWTDIFDGIDVKIDEDWINAKLKEVILHYTDAVTVIDKWISVENNKACLMVVLSNNFVHSFPFEN